MRAVRSRDHGELRETSGLEDARVEGKIRPVGENEPDA